MGQAKLIPPSNVLSLRIPRAWKGEAGPAAKTNTYRPGDIEPPLPLTPERLELIKAYAAHVSRDAQRFAPRAEPAAQPGEPQPAPHAPLAPFSALASGISRLTALLVAVALLPNLTLAAFWLGLIDPPWSRPPAPPPAASHAPPVQSTIASPVLSAPETLEATEGQEITLQMALDGTDGVPPGSIIVIRGLPHGSTLSNGRPQGETDWNLKPDEIGDLYLTLPATGSGESTLTIQLLAPNNGVLADAATTLKIAADQTASITADAIETEPAKAQVSEITDKEPGEIGLEAGAANADPEISASDLPPLPTRRPAARNANDSDQADWIRPSAYVNLRQSPTSSAAVVSVIAKGTKLRVMGRKRGWVKVTNPATSQSGWIYSGNTDTVR